jgi:hypothetical protein
MNDRSRRQSGAAGPDKTGSSAGHVKPLPAFVGKRNFWRARWQAWDATLTVNPSSVTLSQFISRGRTLSRTYTASAESSFFDVSPNAYYDSTIPWNSVLTAGSGLKIDIVGVSDDKASYRLHVYR